MKASQSVILGLSVLTILSSCGSNKGSKEYLNDWKFTENIDKAKIVQTDGESGKMFDLLSSKTTGINFNNELIETFDLNYYRYGYSYNGAGVGVGDFNNDGLQDLYFAGNVVPDRMFLNKGGMQFEDVTAKSGINKKPGWSTGVTVVDINEDGWKDIYVCRARFEDPEKRRNLLYVNNGDGTFTEKAKEYGIDDDSYSTHANFFDADNDGDLDLYVVTHPTDFKDKNKQKNFQKIEEGTNMSNRFYRNEGNGKFTECHKEVGINNHGFGLSVTTGDINDDGWMDVFVGNDYIMHDYTYLNQGNGTFKESSRDVLMKTAYYGMGTDLADYNNDMLLDMFTVDMDIEGNYGTKTFMQSNKQTFLRTLVNGGYLQQYGRNALQLNNGVGKFSEVANFAGVSTTGWSWSPLFADYDNDGYKDLYVSNGFLKDSHMDIMEVYVKLTRANRLSDSTEYYELRKQIPESSVLEWPNAMFHNNGDLTFTDVREDWGLYFPSTSYGAAYADFDNDGDVDIVVSNANMEAFIARNNSSKLNTNKYLRVDLKGEKGNPEGLGAKVYVTTSTGTQMVQMETVKGYLSCSEPVAHFGIGSAEKVDQLVVRWLDGKENVLTNVAANQTVVVDHSTAMKPIKSAVPKPDALFVNATEDLKVDFVHKENEFDDFDREFLIPKELSNLGPGVAVGDINGDGMDDFFVGGAKNQSGAIYTQTANGTFAKTSFAEGTEDIQSEDMGAIFFDADGDNDNDLYVVSGGSDFPKDDVHLQDRLYINDGNGKFSWAKDALPKMISSGSVVAAQDFDKDGDLDLFVGTRIIPGNYPYPTKSYILQNNKGKFTDITSSVAPDLEKIGLVSAAIWTDVNNDGDYDLMLTGEWMPITIFENNGGKFKNITNAAGLSESTGWWNSLTAGDFDNDGDMDYVAGNFGTNLKYRPKEKPIELFYDDYDNNGTHDIIMGYWQHDKLYPEKTRERMIEQIKDVETIFPDWDSYGRAEVWDFYGKKRMENSQLHYKANSFYTSYIENQGNNKFAVKRLPNDIQISSTFGIVPMDVNQDGNLDIVAHGNFYETEIETNTQDAGIGNVLLGNGDGTFTPLHARYSGFYSAMNAKSLAMIKVGAAKTPVLLTTNSNNKMEAFKLAKNTAVGVNANDAYAVITFSDGKQRKQEFYNGAGYLSQSARAVVVNDAVSQVVVYDNKGTARTIFGQQVSMNKK
ncbi:MAG TPA: VCBS repeat-containing protein [Chitinophagales bacterium]|nr:VCBS repeat-containing protein [Chitinophagales bacterium]HMX03194.1 VCBS repeat-containing protein [Chitinophagales bacterium]HNA56745.1 VCBS repeat-containing protein [Chitinophagales bacterium]HNE44746.1 VCBS repeat-containing protein [Chitinophagales bacterium]HNF69373.1 VCBS repeat-containing protein [Chitinophagales bacterium]